MTVAVDLYTAAPLLFTFLAVILASIYFKLRSPGDKHAAKAAKGAESEDSKPETAEDQTDGEKRSDGEVEAKKEEGVKKEEKTSEKEEKKEDEGKEKAGNVAVKEIGGGEKKAPKKETEREEKNAKADKESPAKDKTVSSKASEAEKEHKEEEHTPESEKSKKVDPESKGEITIGGGMFSFKYDPTKLRGTQYEQMLTKEEREEEQRVQREQLSSILQLMKENQETFGEMSEGDIEEQLKLYAL